MGKAHIEELVRRVCGVARRQRKTRKGYTCSSSTGAPGTWFWVHESERLEPDDGLPRRERIEVLVLHELGIFLNDRIEHPRTAHAHSLAQIVKVVGDLRLQTNARIKT